MSFRSVVLMAFSATDPRYFGIWDLLILGPLGHKGKRPEGGKPIGASDCLDPGPKVWKLQRLNDLTCNGPKELWNVHTFGLMGSSPKVPRPILFGDKGVEREIDRGCESQRRERQDDHGFMPGGRGRESRSPRSVDRCGPAEQRHNDDARRKSP